MNLSTKPNSIQTYQVILYDRALHPETFPLKARRSLDHAAYELEAWVMPGSHMLRFRNNGSCLSELVTHWSDGLPTDGAITAFPCAGEHDFEEEFDGKRLRYATTVQTETLSETLYATTLEELLEYAQETDALVHRWSRNGAINGTHNGNGNGNGHHNGGRHSLHAGACLSILDIQRFNCEVHAQSFHLMADCGLVLRTQTIFQHR